MERKIIISSDSTCDLSKELIDRYNIRVLPLGVTLGDNIYRDGVDITPDDICAYVAKTGQLPKTSAINIAENADFFAELTPLLGSSNVTATEDEVSVMVRPRSGSAFLVHEIKE
jgi:hypothetical protein